MTLRTLLSLLLLIGARAGAAEPRTGEQIYRQACAYCHGKTGEGTKKHPHPLVGDKSPGQLTKVIAKTMPESDPGSLSADDARKVSAYVYDTFYSPDALARNKPPRVELSRLTVRQYRNAVADVIGGFRAAPAKWDDKRGLRGEYFDSRNFRTDKRAIDRLDPEVRFDFGVNSPVDKKIDAAQFAIRWSGSLLAPETGVYEFTVRTDQAARLWVNDPNKPLVDAWVKSGNDLEHKATLFLLAGRAYPVRLEFSKAKQGVDDSKTKKPKPRNAMIALAWKPPHGTTGTIPVRHLSPAGAPETFAVETSFPPDDRSYGWERANTVSKAWDAATTDAAIETADYITAKLNELAKLGGGQLRRRRARDGNPASIDLRGTGGPKVSQSEREKKLRDFCERFAELAFRRPLSTDQKAFFIERQFKEVRDPDAAVKRVVLLVLKSPRFLYREVGGGPDAYDVASRLSFALWDSIPDRELLDAAKAGKLSTREQVAKQAERMLSDPRAHAKLQRFLLTWLKLDAAPEISKDAKQFPDFNAALVADLRTSLELFLEDVVWGSSSDFRRLLQADEVYLNGRLAKFYGAKLPADAQFQKVKLDAGRRAGVLTHPYLMSSFAYTADSSPIHRGVFLARGVLGVTLRPPPDAFTPLPARLHPTLTTRERITLQTKPQACVTCHGVINPLGFTLEHFDAVGRYRDKDHGKPVDATGQYETRAGELKKFTGVDDLAKFLAGSTEVHTAFVTQLFHNLVQQPVRAYGPRRPEELRTFFAHSGFNIRKLAVEIATTAALTGREPKQQAQRREDFTTKAQRSHKETQRSD